MVKWQFNPIGSRDSEPVNEVSERSRITMITICIKALSFTKTLTDVEDDKQ